jgi:hypothetical protein
MLAGHKKAYENSLSSRNKVKNAQSFISRPKGLTDTETISPLC